MRTSIALSAAALLLAAAGARPGPRFPDSRPPAAEAVDTPPLEAPLPAAFLETLVGALLPSTPADPALIGEIIRFHEGSSPEAQEEELALLGDNEALKAELRRAFNLGRYSRADRLTKRILENAPQDAFSLDLRESIREARRERVLHFTQTRPSGRLDAETLDDLTLEEWREISVAILDDRRVSLDVERASFEWVLLILQLDSGLPLTLAASAAEQMRIGPPVTLRFCGIPLRQALRFVLDQVDPWLEMEVVDGKAVLIRNGRDPDRY